MYQFAKYEEKILTALSGFIILLSAIIESYSPAGVYLGCGYIIAVMLTLYAPSKLNSIVASVASSIVILFSVFYLHEDESFMIVTVNHLCSLIGVIMAMFFVLFVKKIQSRADDINKQLSSLFANATEGILLTNRNGKIVLVNPCAEKMFGYDQDELLDKKIEILIPDSFKHSHVTHREGFHEKPVNRSMGAGRDLFAKRKDGNSFPVEISLSHFNSGRESYAIAFIIDITIRKNSEVILLQQKQELERISNEVKQLNMGLERKVEDRTMMLRETLAQLEQSKEELELSLEKEKELNDLKTRFVSTVSHEFRTPLSTVLSSAALISRYTSSEDQDKRDRHIARIKDSVKHLNDMLEDLLSLSKLEEGLIGAKPEPFNLTVFLHDFVNEMQEICGKGQQILLSITDEGEAVTDKRLLKNILLNLTSNAIKFSPENSAIEISAIHTSEQLSVSVKDSGIGISKEDQQHLFQRFFRARNAANIQGTGLGLHIVSRYLELLKGNISLQSELGGGTTFTVSIPAK
ncbi:MAG: PAS domain-containing sensor histidine kinase [Chitinophagales bacterium]